MQVEVFARDGYVCTHRGGAGDLHADHIEFRKDGGRTSDRNGEPTSIYTRAGDFDASERPPCPEGWAGFRALADDWSDELSIAWLHSQPGLGWHRDGWVPVRLPEGKALEADVELEVVLAGSSEARCVSSSLLCSGP